MKLLLLLSGPVAVGKTGIADALIRKHDFQSIKSSSYLRSLAAQRKLEQNRTNLQQIGDQLDGTTDYRWLIDDVALPSLASAPNQKRWLIDSVRKQRQIQHFREQFADSIWHVHLTAPERTIEERYVTRLTAGGESGKVPYAIAISHENEISSRSLIKIADVVLDLELITPEKAALTIVKEWNERKGYAPDRIN